MCIVRNLGLDVVNAKGGESTFAAPVTNGSNAGYFVEKLALDRMTVG